MLAVGLGFLTAAAFIALTVSAGVITACVVLGTAYAGGGLILAAFAAASHKHRPATQPTHTAAADWTGLAAAFAQGYGAGSSVKHRRH
ncbi:hypothetical protein [Pseudoprimorskyibacter insulae]|nr:hypothetical protein [Pseudoprimorskyibacter insulae]